MIESVLMLLSTKPPIMILKGGLIGDLETEGQQKHLCADLSIGNL